MVKFSSIFGSARALALLAALSARTATAYVPIWQPQYPNEAAVTARVIELKHAGDATGHLLATFEHWYYPLGQPTNYKQSNGTPSNFFIQESSDQGQSWSTLATVTAPDDVPNLFFFQPFLFEFPQQLGKYPEGTLLLVGNLHDGNKTYFYSWRSADHGETWDDIGIWQKGHAITGAPGNPSAGIWEPFLFLDNQNDIVAVFSDERECETHSQQLVHLVSTDGGDTWSGNGDDPVPDVVGSDQESRPGMATVAKMDNGEYFMSYEWCDIRYYQSTGSCPVHGKTSSDGVSWNPSDNGTYVSTPDGVLGCGSPYSIWDPVGKQLIVSSSSKRWFSVSETENRTDTTMEDHHVVHINQNYGKDDWYWASAPWYVPAGTDDCNSNYSPDLLPLPNGEILYSTDTPNDSNQCEEGTLAAPIAILPYSSNFSTAGAAGWVDFDGIWTISGDQYQFPSVSQPTMVLTGSSGWTDYEISAAVIITSQSGVAGVFVRASNSPNDSHLSRYTAVIDSNRGELTLYRVGDADTTTLESQPVTGGVMASQQYHLSLSVQSANLVATLTGSNGATTTVTVTNSDLLRGAAGLYGSYGSGGFSNVQIKDLS
ncbi:hypothetical protein N7468_006167 [Penicillium chermesinum]|uniref:Sialidase domain-containing protein n=1 Tax=Penicillium chermesinum TaxID=63820 RepID=A0A9W9TJB3_9EURO|nr:uncharacterized protein N7468_006167 [Penicillium chermesinum]KAJ5224942.1 hypothetical protein N7468_006167 [Penicillium chermesinum]